MNADLPWVSVEERMPTQDDADENDCVLWATDCDWWESYYHEGAEGDATHWCRTSALPLPGLQPLNRYRAITRDGTVVESPKPEPKCLGIAHLPQGTVFLPDSVGPERLYLVTDEGSAVCLDSGIVREDWWFASNEVDVVQAKMVVSKRRFKDRKSTSPSVSTGAR